MICKTLGSAETPVLLDEFPPGNRHHKLFKGG